MPWAVLISRMNPRRKLALALLLVAVVLIAVEVQVLSARGTAVDAAVGYSTWWDFVIIALVAICSVSGYRLIQATREEE